MRNILSGAGRSSRHERDGHGRGRTVLRRATKGGRGSEPFSGRFGSHIATGQIDRLLPLPGSALSANDGRIGNSPPVPVRPNVGRTGSFPIPMHFAYGNMPGSDLASLAVTCKWKGSLPFLAHGNMEGSVMRLAVAATPLFRVARRGAPLPEGRDNLRHF